MKNPPETLPDARWSCRGCGVCCRGYRFGPVEPRIIENLEKRGIAGLWPPAAEGPWHEPVPRPDGTSAFFLTHRDGHCVFLQDDNLCAVHRLLGAEAKPWFCREYPLLPVEDALDGRVSVVVRPDCGGLHESFEDGEAVAPQAEAVLELPRPVPRSRFEADLVVILPGMGIPVETFRQLEPHLLRHLSEAREPEAQVAHARGILYDAVGRAAPEVGPGVRVQALGFLLSRLQEIDPSPVFQRALERLMAPLPALDAQGQRYVGLLLRGGILSRRFAALGSLPALFGLFLLEATVARLDAPEQDAPLGPAAIGPTMAKLQRMIQHPDAWQLLRAQRGALEAVFQHTKLP